MSLDVLVVALEDISVKGVGWSLVRVGTCQAENSGKKS